jgi:hypothetical protein
VIRLLRAVNELRHIFLTGKPDFGLAMFIDSEESSALNLCLFFRLSIHSRK